MVLFGDVGMATIWIRREEFGDMAVIWLYPYSQNFPRGSILEDLPSGNLT
jgi:hypothetical protein